MAPRRLSDLAHFAPKGLELAVVFVVKRPELLGLLGGEPHLLRQVGAFLGLDLLQAFSRDLGQVVALGDGREG